MTIPLGFEVGTGAPVAIPLHHTVVTGLTQHAGKTTTIEALIARSGLRALCFSTKRGEIGFKGAREVRPYFRERADWQYVEAILSATLREKMKFERSWIMNAVKGAETLAQVHANVKRLLLAAKRGMDQGIYTTLDHYLEIVVPQIAQAKFSPYLELGPGLNLMDLGHLSDEMQALVIRSAIEHVMVREKGVVTVIPEAWQFLPNGRRGPVYHAAESLIREGAILGNWMWLDSQDIVGVDTLFRKGCGVWLLGKQTETNEAERTVAQIPVPRGKRPAVAEVMALGKGEFFACFDGSVRKVYVQPAWLKAEQAEAAARGVTIRGVPVEHKRPEPTQEDPSMCQEHAKLATKVEKLEADLRTVREESEVHRQDVLRLERETDALAELRQAWGKVFGAGAVAPAGAIDTEAVVRTVLARIPAGNGATIQVLAPEALARKVQREVADRIVADATGLTANAKKILKTLIVLDKRVSQKAAAERAGVSTGGSMIEAFKGLNNAGLIDVHDKAGTKAGVRERITRDLVDLGADASYTEAVYQHVLHALATEA